MGHGPRQIKGRPEPQEHGAAEVTAGGVCEVEGPPDGRSHGEREEAGAGDTWKPARRNEPKVRASLAVHTGEILHEMAHAKLPVAHALFPGSILAESGERHLDQRKRFGQHIAGQLRILVDHRQRGDGGAGVAHEVDVVAHDTRIALRGFGEARKLGSERLKREAAQRGAQSGAFVRRPSIIEPIVGHRETRRDFVAGEAVLPVGPGVEGMHQLAPEPVHRSFVAVEHRHEPQRKNAVDERTSRVEHGNHLGAFAGFFRHIDDGRGLFVNGGIGGDGAIPRLRHR